jgi:hypothetical protein
LIDRITILEIKAARITEPDKLENIQRELQLLNDVRANTIPAAADIESLTRQLRDVNAQLWEIEDRIRDRERLRVFDDEFIELARRVYLTNDRRAALKRQINTLLGSRIVEEKSYQPY